MTENLVVRQDVEGICYLTLNRPDRLNALNVDIFNELKGHITDLAEQTDAVGCVVLSGAGKCFSAGHDMTDIAEGEAPPDPFFQTNIIQSLSELPQPVVVAVRGHCYTGALELALAADIILASENAKFADTHAKWGLAPGWGMSVRLPKRIGRAKAIEMMMTCRTYSGAEAVELGLANACFADEDFEKETKSFCDMMLKNSWHSLQGNKALVDLNLALGVCEGLQYELRHSPGIAPDSAERIASFMKK